MVFGSLAPIIRCLHRRGLLHQFRGAASTADLKRGYYDNATSAAHSRALRYRLVLHKKAARRAVLACSALGEVITEDWLYL
jgi:hypothetical protein